MIFSTPNNSVNLSNFLELSKTLLVEISLLAKVAFMALYFAAFKSMPNISTVGV